MTTKYRQIIQIEDLDSNEICTFDFKYYQDQAVYKLDLFGQNPNLQTNCTIQTVKQGRNNFWPLLILSSIILSVICFNLLRNTFSNYLNKRRASDLIEAGNLNRLDSTIKHADILNSSRIKRSISVDVFRG